MEQHTCTIAVNAPDNVSLSNSLDIGAWEVGKMLPGTAVFAQEESL